MSEMNRANQRELIVGERRKKRKNRKEDRRWRKSIGQTTKNSDWLFWN